MFDQILKMATAKLGETLTANPDVPNEQVPQLSQEAGNTILNTITEQLKSGNLGGITEMLSGQETTTNSPVVGGITNSVVSNLVEKLGLSPAMAQTVATAAVPMVMNMFNDKVNEKNEEGGVDIASMLSGALSGGQQDGGGLLGGVLGNMLGGNKQDNKSGGQDVLSAILGNFLK